MERNADLCDSFFTTWNRFLHLLQQFGNFWAGIAVSHWYTIVCIDIELLLHLIDIQLNMQILPNYCYYRHSSNSYFIGEWVYGPLVPFTFGNEAYVNLGKPLFPYEVCAFYHCHPPYYGPDYRLTGASQEDENLAYKLDIPGFVFDYSYSSVWGTYDYETEADFPTTYVFGPRQRSPYKFY